MLTNGEEKNSEDGREERKIEKNQRMAGAELEGAEDSDSWEEVDGEDGEMEEIEEVNEQESGSSNNEESKSATTMINTGNAPEEVIGDSASSIAANSKTGKSMSSHSSAIAQALKSGKKGKTRAEAFANLDIKQAELLSTGEIKLPNGKIIGHRDYRHIYR